MDNKDFILHEKTSEVAFIDDNHVVKAIRNQILSGTELKIIGSYLIQPGIFAHASLNISKDLYEVKDFASDALVLGICDPKLIKKIIEADFNSHAISKQSQYILSLTLVFLRLFLISTNADDIDFQLRIAFKWCAMIWFLSIEGIHFTTLKNIVTNTIGSIFLYPQERIKCPRYCTEEPCEHYFGCTRQFEREFTIRGFIQYDDRINQFFSSAFRSALNTGGNSSKGYASTLTGLVASVTAMQEKQRKKKLSLH
ncbi:uncharacterized protein LOC136085832 [Hydra vulgaris]|uniref:Uncharacterized protein LOC136085832 n=1 Tax=Hydra vulgaris TaxID=6087 RepID=A0ABM4CNV2_HYDVU